VEVNFPNIGIDFLHNFILLVDVMGDQLLNRDEASTTVTVGFSTCAVQDECASCIVSSCGLGGSRAWVKHQIIKSAGSWQFR
jgi:hypothetical protein